MRTFVLNRKNYIFAYDFHSTDLLRKVIILFWTVIFILLI